MTLTGLMCPRCKEPLGVCLIPKPEGGPPTAAPGDLEAPYGFARSFSVVARPKRMTRCRKYKPGQGGRICKGCGETRDEALGKWKDPDGRGPVLES